MSYHSVAEQSCDCCGALRQMLAIALLPLMLIGCGRNNTAEQNREIAASLHAHAPPGNLPTLAPMLARISPAVVNISVQGTVRVAQNPLFQDPLFRRFFGIPQQPETQRFQAVGSGVIIDAAHGLVVTNDHVVKNAQQIQVTLKDRRQRTAKLIGADPQTDIAVLQIEADDLKSVPLGASKDLKVGDYVVAIGDPFGLGQTATFGIVSALGRTGLGIENYEDFIQTDASINPGNSGGALVNLAGQLVGMNTAILSQSGGNVGVGFAIPVDMVSSIARELIANGKISRGALGVVIQDLTPELAGAMGVKSASGAVVSQVQPHSAADSAGLKPGDIITAMNGITIGNSNDLRNAVGEEEPHTNVRLTLLRNGRQMSVKVTLGTQNTRVASASEPASAHQESALLSGLTTGAIPHDDPEFGHTAGVYVQNVDPASAAADAGLRQGDIILSAGHRRVANAADLDRIAHAQPQGKPLLLQVKRGDAILFMAIG